MAARGKAPSEGGPELMDASRRGHMTPGAEGRAEAPAGPPQPEATGSLGGRRGPSAVLGGRGALS